MENDIELKEDERENKREKKEWNEDINRPKCLLKEPPKIPEPPKPSTNSSFAFYKIKLSLISKIMLEESYTLNDDHQDMVLWNGLDPRNFKNTSTCLVNSLKRIYLMEKIKIDFNTFCLQIEDALYEFKEDDDDILKK